MEKPKAYTVSAITRMIKDNLESSFKSIWIEGEISNYVHHSSGHRYLNLKDDKAVLKVTIWRSVGEHLRFTPEDGQKVLAGGDITVYEKGGAYQLNCRRLLPVGMGELELAFRQLHEKLTQEGLFSPERKQRLPRFARRIGIVTSPTGAALRDIIQIARRRNNQVELVIYPATVQGDGAEKTIAAGIEYFNTRSDIDLLIVGRGGGSLEDLWCFNTEISVRAIVASRIPVISAVGHEVDTTLADLAADLRAPTPSAAAELAVWSRSEYLDLVDGHQRSQTGYLGGQVRQARRELAALISRPVFARPQDMVRQRQQQRDNLVSRLSSAGKNSFEKHKNRLSLTAARLEALSPLRILARGYSVSRRLPSERVLKSINEITPGDRMETILCDGHVVSFVEKIGNRKRNASPKEEA